MTTAPANIQSQSYKWLILALSAFTFTFVVAIPQMSLPVLFGIFWWRTQEKAGDGAPDGEQRADFRVSISHVMRPGDVWLLCIATACVSGCVNGMLGFLPLYLRNLGWQPAHWPRFMP